jgi:IS5 family transposase
MLDWERFRTRLEPHYDLRQGRPGDGLLMLKLEYLQFRDLLSDRQVLARAQTDLAYRFFLGLGRDDPLPDPSTLCYFRGRLGVQGHQALFDELLTQARQRGLVQDRLRLKDATEMLAKIAVPATLTLVAQVRDKLLAAAEAFEPLRVEGERARREVIRATTDGGEEPSRLLARVVHLREILAWVDELPPPEADAANPAWQRLGEARRLAHKILADQEQPQAGDRTRSASDPEARRGKHGDYYDGYLLDVMMDADSELITAVNVLPANGDEALDAVELVRQEEAAQGNQIEALSMDGAGFHGPMLRALEDPQGWAVEVIVPPKAEAEGPYFPPEAFVEDAPGKHVTCPAGQTSQYRQRDAQQHATIYRFAAATCADCPLRPRCMEQPPAKLGRSVRKNDYQGEYQRVRARAQTPRYAEVRRAHPKVERKLSELVNRYGVRRARYWGRWKGHGQLLMTALTANVGRMLRLLRAPAAEADAC